MYLPTVSSFVKGDRAGRPYLVKKARPRDEDGLKQGIGGILFIFAAGFHFLFTLD
ncbi:MAG: hypothetical protein ACPGAP_03100 [Akkermansiaceae bacterium]